VVQLDVVSTNRHSKPYPNNKVGTVDVMHELVAAFGLRRTIIAQRRTFDTPHPPAQAPSSTSLLSSSGPAVGDDNNVLVVSTCVWCAFLHMFVSARGGNGCGLLRRLQPSHRLS
jgi:hypothetical protein